MRKSNTNTSSLLSLSIYLSICILCSNVFDVSDKALRLSCCLLPYQHAELGKRLGKSVTDVLLHLDRVTGDDQVRGARRKQVHKSSLIIGRCSTLAHSGPLLSRHVVWCNVALDWYQLATCYQSADPSNDTGMGKELEVLE